MKYKDLIIKFNARELAAYKKRRRIQTLLAITGITAGIGGGIGIGYAVSRSQSTDVTPKIVANVDGNLQLGNADKKATIVMTGYDNASSNVTSVMGEGIEKGIKIAEVKGNVVTLAIGNVREAGNYDIVISNGAQLAHTQISVWSSDAVPTLKSSVDGSLQLNTNQTVTLSIVQTNVKTPVKIDVIADNALVIDNFKISDFKQTATIGLGNATKVGDYTITISAEGFETIEQIVTVRAEATEYIGEQDGSNWIGFNQFQSLSNELQFDDTSSSVKMIISETISDLGAGDNLAIPKYVRKATDAKIYTMSAIDHNALYAYSLKGTLTIPNTIKTIGSYIFSGNHDNVGKKDMNKLVFNYASLDGLDFADDAFAESEYAPWSVTNGTVVNLNPALSSADLLTFLKGKGLMNTWTAA